MVRELDLENETDTLARWMAHHLAETMHAAEEAETEEERARARGAAEETILRIWTHRAVLPGGADPLARHRDLVRALAALEPDEPAEFFTRSDADSPAVKLARQLQEVAWRLRAAALLVGAEPPPDDALLRGFLDADETKLIRVLDTILYDLDDEREEDEGSRNEESKPPDVRSVALGLVEDAERVTAGLRRALTG